jgi:hypothetical protein
VLIHVDSLPRPLTRVEPRRPEWAWSRLRADTVVVEALVGENGQVQDASVVRPIPGLSGAAEAIARQWTFRPALNDSGKPVAWWTPVTIVFASEVRDWPGFWEVLVRADTLAMSGGAPVPVSVAGWPPSWVGTIAIDDSLAVEAGSSNGHSFDKCATLTRRALVQLTPDSASARENIVGVSVTRLVLDGRPSDVVIDSSRYVALGTSAARARVWFAADSLHLLLHIDPVPSRTVEMKQSEYVHDSEERYTMAPLSGGWMMRTVASMSPPYDLSVAFPAGPDSTRQAGTWTAPTNPRHPDASTTISWNLRRAVRE